MPHKPISILLVLLSTSEILSLTFNEEPVDTAVLLDKTAQFNCSLTCTASDICNGLTWSERVSSTSGSEVDIYYENGNKLNPNHPNVKRYAIVPGTTNLLIHNVKTTDAGRYICKPNQGAVDNTTKFAFLTTIDGSTCKRNGDAVAGGRASVVCNTKFTKSADAENTKKPKLSWGIQGATENSAEGANEITSTANFTVTKADNGRNVTCRTYYENPPPMFTHTCTTSIVVQFAPEIISITTNATGGWSIIQPDDTVTCSASGNPDPSYRWRKVEGPGADVINGQNITIVAAMQGNNTYTCNASNSVDNATRSITFIVVVPTTTTTTTVAPTTTEINTTPLDTSPAGKTTDPNTGGSTGGGNPSTNTAAIAGGCAAGAVVIIIIIVVVIVMKRRKQKEAKDGFTADEEKQPGPPQTNPTMHPDVIRPANQNENPYDKNHEDPRNKNIENLQYADLALDDTPRSRKPIQLYDMGAQDTEYAEIQHGKRNY